MERTLTSHELRIAARQAITLAMTMSDEGARDGLLRRAQSLLDEAAAQSGVVILGAQRGRHIAGPATEGDGSVWSAPQASRPAMAAQLSSCSMFAAQERE